MNKKRFKLIGHDNPLGYPAPVLPIGKLDNELVAVYATDRATVIVLEDEEYLFIHHNDYLRETLKDFDYLNERLFAFNEDSVISYAIDNETDYFIQLLQDNSFSKENPFLRLSLAKATNDIHLLIQELGTSLLRIIKLAPRLTETWYARQIYTLSQQLHPLDQLIIPETWKDLLECINDAHNDTEWLQSVEQSDYKSETEEKIYESRTPIDFAIITTLKEELEIVIAKLPNAQRVVSGTDDIRVYYKAELPIVSNTGLSSYSIGLVSLQDFINDKSIDIIGDIAQILRTHNIIYIGTTAGVQRNGAELGDVIVSDKIISYLMKDLKVEREISPYTINQINPDILVSIRQIRDSRWQRFIKEKRPQKGEPKCIIGPTALSNTLIKTEYDLTQLINSYNKLIGINIDAKIITSLSLQLEEKINLVIIQGISDLIDQYKKPKNPSSWRLYAADVAASFAIEILKQGVLFPDEQKDVAARSVIKSSEIIKQEERNIKGRSELSEGEIDHYLQLAKTYQTEKRYSEAETILRKILAIDSYEIGARVELSKIYQTQKKWIEAEDMLLKTLEIDPTLLQVRTELSKIYQALMKWREAEEILLESLRIDNNQLHPRTELSKIYQRQRRWREAEEILLELFKLDSNNLQAHTELSKIYQQQKRWKEAENILLESLSINNLQLHPRTELSKIYQHQGKWKEAEEVLLQELAIDSEALHPRTELSKIYQQQRNWKEAEEILLESLNIDNQQLSPRIELSKIYQQQRKLKEAEDILLEALELDPKGLQVRFELSKLFSKQEIFEKALSFLQECIAIAPEDINSLMELGKIYTRLGNFIEAEKIFKQVINIDFDNVPARIELASLYLKLKRHKEREDVLFQIYEINPQDVWILIALSKVFRRFKKYRVALHLLESALEIRDSDLLLVCELIELHSILRDKKNVEHYLLKGRSILDNAPYNKFKDRFTKIKIEFDENATLLNLNEIGYAFKIDNERYIKSEVGNNYVVRDNTIFNYRVGQNEKVFFATYKIEEEVIADFIEPFFESTIHLRQLI